MEHCFSSPINWTLNPYNEIIKKNGGSEHGYEEEFFKHRAGIYLSGNLVVIFLGNCIFCYFNVWHRFV